jgi:hypothetical protein
LTTTFWIAPIASTDVYRSISYIDCPAPTATARSTTAFHSLERAPNGVAVPDIRLDKVGFTAQVRGRAVVDLRVE